VHKLVVDAAAKCVELWELEHSACVRRDKCIDALDVEESFERLRTVVGVH
jgi:hypothetical protein